MSEEQKRLLEKQLWGVANVLRGKMNADEYKNYILGFIFYKYLSEKLERYVNEKLLASEDFKFAEIKEKTKEGKTYLDHIKAGCIGHLGFFLKPSELFSYLVKKGKGNIKDENTFILEDLKNVLNTIEQTSMGTASEDDFKGLFDDVDLTSTKLGSRENQKNEVIIEVLTLLSDIDFKLEDVKSDLLGDAYEYLIGEFAAGAGKKGGEFYTPAQVSRLLAQIVSQDKKRVRSVYDPTCGSGSLLLRIGDFTEVVEYYGQELNTTTYNLARMNMILHGVHFDHFDIRQGDTLTEDMHADLKAEVIVANPPFSANWKSDTDPQLAHDDRFSQYGRLAPKSAADYAFVTHMLYHLADNGVMAIVLPHGALFRSGAEGHIRKYIIEKQNYLDAVIGLPANLFYGAAISATVLVFKKCRKDDEDILFIDASREFERIGNQNRLTDENIEKIFNTYKTRKEIKKYSHRASIKEIRENDYYLNIPRYVDTFEVDKMVDIELVSKNLAQLLKIEKGVSLKISKYCDELNLPKLEGNNLYLLKEYKKGVMQKIFAQEIRFKYDNGNEFSEWEEKTLGEVANFRRGSFPQPYGLRKWYDDKKGFPFVQVFDVDENFKLKSSTKRRITNEAKELSVLVEKGTIVLTIQGSIGRIALTQYDTCVDRTLLIFKSFNIPIDKMFFMQIVFLLFEIEKMKAPGGTIKTITKEALSSFKLLIPSLPEQQKIADFLTSIDKVIELKEQRITQVE